MPSLSTSVLPSQIAASARSTVGDRRRPVLGEAALPLAFALALAAYVVFSTARGVDYNLHYPVAADNAAPAIAALSHGAIGRFLSQQPLMGLLSLLLRAPAAWLAGTLGGGQTLAYRLGALVCMLPVAALAAWLVTSSRAARATAAGVVAAAVVLLGPPTLSALAWGHPEEVLTATLVAAALLAANRGHATWTGLLVGAAIGTKEWAAVAVVPALMALPAGRLRAALAAGVAALALAMPAPLLDLAAFARASRALGGTHFASALSAWWPLSSGSASPLAGASSATLPAHMTKSLALPLGLGLAIVAALALAWAARRPGARLRACDRVPDAFALLCALAVVRCIADPGPVEYYYVAAVIPLAVWEAVVIRRLPVVTLLTVAAVWLTFGQAAKLAPALLNAFTLSWTGALICYLGYRAFRVGRVRPPELTDPLISSPVRPIRNA